MKTYIRCFCIFNFIVFVSFCLSNHTIAQQKVSEQPTSRSNLTETTTAGLLSQLSSTTKADTTRKNNLIVFQTTRTADSLKVGNPKLIQTTQAADSLKVGNPKLIQTVISDSGLQGKNAIKPLSTEKSDPANSNDKK